MHVLEVRNFAQIEHARIEFGHLTVLVGPQASGKSLLLQWLKAALDMGEIVGALRGSGHDVTSAGGLLDLVFGEGMQSAWRKNETQVRYDNRPVDPKAWTRGLRTKALGSVFFVPAHRALLLSEGWPAPFLKLNADTPVVARLFSQNLYERFSGRRAAALFPDRILKKQYRTLIDHAIFHGGRVELDKEGLRYRLRLKYDGAELPFMAWSAGQREFTPLLLGLYHLLPPRREKKKQHIEWVVIEEPEMGLHPHAITAFMVLVLDLLWRGYRVVLSTHAPVVLDALWAVRRLAEHGGHWQDLSHALGVRPTAEVRRVMEGALARDYRVHFLDLDPKKGRAMSHDISNLDPESADPGEAEWGGLTGFSSRFGEAVRTAVNAAERS